MAAELLRNYSTEVYQATKVQGWDGRSAVVKRDDSDEDDAERQWTFAGSLLFSVTVITTIGTLHVEPPYSRFTSMSQFSASTVLHYRYHVTIRPDTKRQLAPAIAEIGTG